MEAISLNWRQFPFFRQLHTPDWKKEVDDAAKGCVLDAAVIARLGTGGRLIKSSRESGASVDGDEKAPSPKKSRAAATQPGSVDGTNTVAGCDAV